MKQRPLSQQSNEGENHEGLVIAAYGANLEVEDVAKQRHLCMCRRKIGHAVCGDQVLWHTQPQQTGLIEEILPRKNLLARPDAHNKLKPIAANIDYIAITLAPIPSAICDDETAIDPNEPLDRLFDFFAIDRYIVASEASGIGSFIVINKIDLLSDEQLSALTVRLAYYEALGYTPIFTCTHRGIGVQQLSEKLQNKTSVFAGQSGVGKSSLIQLFVDNEELQVGSLSKVTGQGRHTTTATRLYHLRNGGYIIDSPGVREFGLWNIEAEKIMHCFREFADYLGTCKFSNCLHRNEPNCAIKKAVEEGLIQEQRYQAYLKVLANLSNPR